MADQAMNEMKPKLLSDLITINEQYARSARIDQDNIAESGFIYSTSIDVFLNTLAKHQSKSSQSAYTWTGPYGSGKSTLALSLISILKGDQTTRELAARNYNNSTAQNIWNAFPPMESGWNVISLVGSRTSLEKILMEELGRGEFDKTNLHDAQAYILAELESRIDESEERGGLILFVDEMGKLLEAAADGDGDVYFYQLLAELASRSNGRFIMIGILHQTFQEYAALASKKIRDEWGKIHGRFVDISFNLTNSEQLEMISNAISAEVRPDLSKDLATQTFDLLTQTKRAPAPTMLDQMERCWPLNPICALALGPISRRSYGQNQRSIFSFLTSGEPLGLRDFVNRTLLKNDTIYNIANLWDYLELNWGSAISVSGDSHHFASVRDALSRLETMEDARPEHQSILKAISVFELTEQLTGVSATHEALMIALNATAHKVTRDTNFLLRNALIIFKKYKKTFGLYEGSDFDIEAELSETLKINSTFSMSSAIQPFLPSEVVAKRHYLETGTLRWLELNICQPNEVDEIVKKFELRASASNFGLLLIVDTTDKSLFDALVDHYTCDNFNFVAFGRSSVSQELKEELTEFLALEKISKNSNALLKDKVARREIRDRLETTKGIIENLVSSTIAKVIWNTGDGDHTALNQLASKLADRVFDKSPIFKNELVNRTKPSGSANAALKQLNYALLKHADKQNLGFEKFPAERGVYESLVKKNKFHQKTPVGFALVNPRLDYEKSGLTQLGELWNSTLEFLRKNKHRKVGFDEIHERWSAPPFGIKAGLFPLLDVLFYLTEKDNVAFYREDIFISTIGEIDVDFLHKTPDLVQLRWLDMDGDTKSFLSKLSDLAVEIGQTKTTSIEPLEVARRLVAIHDDVEPWAKRTARVSDNAKRVRTLFKRASDPAQFTLNDLPNIYGQTDLSCPLSVDNLISKIRDGLIELRSVYSVTISRFRDLVLGELGISVPSETNLMELNSRANLIKGLSGINSMESFILRVSQLTTELSSFEKLAWVVLGKPKKSWIDNDIDRLFVEATKLAREFNSLETMTSISGNTQTKYAFSLLSHSNFRETQSKARSFELSEKEMSEAEGLARQLKNLQGSSKFPSANKTLLAALTLLIEEREIND